MANENENSGDVDLSTFVPDSFKGEDGAYDTGAFRESFDSLSSFKSQTDEAVAALPKEAGDYAWAIPEGHVLPEGFDVDLLRQPDLNEDGSQKVGEDGKPLMKDFDINSMIDADDKDLPLLQAALHKHGAKPELMGEIASILANRELGSVLSMTKEKDAQMAALGPNGKSRVDHVTRTVKAMLPEAQANALNDGIMSADALKGMEALLLKQKSPPAAQQGHKIDNSTASINERLQAGLAGRKSA